MYTLKIPFAIDINGEITSPMEAIKGKDYFCPNCNCRLTTRKGQKKTHHFSHRSSITCNYETIIHKTAKALIRKAVLNWKEGKAPAPRITRKCGNGEHNIVQKLPDKIDDAILEYRLQNGYIADIALMHNKSPIGLIEIKVTHSLDDQKIMDLSIPFIEVDGNDILFDPTHWKPILDHFKSFECKMCISNHQKHLKKTRAVASRLKISLPETFYRYSIYRCWKCKREIIVYAWPDGEMSENKPMGNPMPSSIQYSYSKTIHGKYWANSCLYCNSIQGDFFLHHEPDGPFFALGISESNNDFLDDMIAIGNYHARLKDHP